MLIELNPDLIVDDVGTEVLICDPKGARVHRLEGDAAELARSMRAASHPVECPMTPVLDGLLDAGIVMEHDDRHGGLVTSGRTMSRRSMMGLGAAATAAGIITLALPEAAAAVSVDGFGDIGVQPPPTVLGNFNVTNEAIISLSTTGNLRIAWPPESYQPFTYGWTSRDSSHTGPVRASGVLTASNSFSGALDSINVGYTIYVSVASNTDPVFIFRQTLTRIS